MNRQNSERDDISRRAPDLYRLGRDGSGHGEPLLTHVTGLDEAPVACNASLIRGFNEAAAADPDLNRFALKLPEGSTLPRAVVLVDASNDRLPTGPESFRVLEDFVGSVDGEIQVTLVDTCDDLLKAASKVPEATLVISQCVDAKAYNIDVLERLTAMGVVTVPGAVTAPGGVFSNKRATYDLLRASGNADLVASYVHLRASELGPSEMGGAILDRASEMRGEWGTDRFFIKPVTGGSGVGGFRLVITDAGFFVPDLSKVTGDASEVHSIYLDVDPSDDARIDELCWIFSMFSDDPYYKGLYVETDLAELKKRFGTGSDREALRAHVTETQKRHLETVRQKSLSREEMQRTLDDAIGRYEKHFNRRYDPVLCEYIDFGAWGLRAHYRATVRGIQLEALYGRIFQLNLTGNGPGYVGSDNISNKHTGVLEMLRLVPVNEIMVAGVGGRQRVCELLRRGARAASALVATQPADLQNTMPVRCQLDLAPIGGKIGEGNADAARGLALTMQWPDFVAQARQWFEDCFKYYALARGRLYFPKFNPNVK